MSENENKYEINYWTLYTSPRGRIPRSVFWKLFYLPLTLLSIWAEYSLDSLPLASFLVILLILWPGMVGLIKRLHDIDVSFGRAMAWQAFGMLGFVAIFLGSVILPDLTDRWMRSSFIAGMIWFPPLVPVMFLWTKVYFFRGTQGPNRYGPETW